METFKSNNMKKTKTTNPMKSKKVWGALAITALAGVAIGVLFTSKNGEKTRKKIVKGLKKNADELIATMKTEASSLLEKAQELEKVSKTKIENVAQSVQKKAGELMNFN